MEAIGIQGIAARCVLLFVMQMVDEGTVRIIGVANHDTVHGMCLRMREGCIPVLFVIKVAQGDDGDPKLRIGLCAVDHH